MGKYDGQVRKDRLYTTSDTSFAAYLNICGFVFLGTIDHGEPRKEFGFTSVDDSVVADLDHFIKQAYEEFKTYRYSPPSDGGIHFSVADYYDSLRLMQRELQHAIRKDEQ